MTKPGTYEIYITVRHHKRHLDDWEERESTAFKLMDTGDPQQMVIDALHSFAEDLAARRGKQKADEELERQRDERTAKYEERHGL